MTTFPSVRPIDAAEAARLFAPFAAPGNRAALAVSGGPDSTALALCAKAAGLKARIFIVEHGLRPESSAEAETVRQRMEKLGFEAEILPWTHGKIESRVHVEARKARFDLLLGACRSHGLGVLFFAHHRGDQAETILMRLAKGSGIEGLAGIAPSRVREGVLLARPFLDISKARLIATCEAADVPFVRDPSNDSDHYARGRLRAVAEVLEKEGLTEDCLIELGRRAAEAAEVVTENAKNFLRRAARQTRFGVVALDLTDFAGLPRAVALKALALCLLTVRPAPYAPERKPLLGLKAILAREEAAACTLHGVEIRKTARRATFVRELASVGEEKEIAPGETTLWDGRWRVSLSGGDGGTVRALGAVSREEIDAFVPSLRKELPQGRARAVLPVLHRGGKLAAIPDFSEENQCVMTASPLAPLWA